MLHVILLILKILGIILLIAAGLLLAALYAVLFVGVSWRIRAEREERFQVAAFASWMFRIITVRFFLEEGSGLEPVVQVRLFGHLLTGGPGREGKGRFRRRWRFWKKKKQRTAPSPKEGADLLQDGGKQEMPERSGIKDPPEAPERGYSEAPEQERTEVRRDEKKPETAESDTASSENPESARTRREPVLRRVFQKTASLGRRLCRKAKNIRKGIKGIKDRIRRLGERKDALLKFWQMEEHRRARSALWKEVRYLWKRSRPRKIKGQIRFGFSDPSHTGLCMGAVGILCAWYPGGLSVIPDFEQRILEGEILIRGKIRCYVFVCILWRIWFNQDIRHMYQHWQEL